MDLAAVRRAPLGWKKRTRVGRGKSAGLGKTCGKGGRGQTVRSGHSLIPYFSGGQMPLPRRLPKRGFNHRRFALTHGEVSLRLLEEKFQPGETVSLETLKQKGLLKHAVDGIRILGGGDLKKPLTVLANGFSAQVRKQIEAAGGQALVLGPRKRDFQTVSLKEIQKRLPSGTVTPATLKEAGLIQDLSRPIKVIFGGRLEKKYRIEAHRFSRKAMDAIRAAGGAAIRIP